MSVVTSIRDYVEVLNTQIGVNQDSQSLFSISPETFPHILKMCQSLLLDVLSFKSLRDNFYRPYLGGLEDIPSIKMLIETQFLDLSSTKNTFSLFQPFSFLLNGFGNSFFVSLPGSIGTLIIIRRIILQGTPAGLAATIGSVFASCCTMIFVTVGGRFLVLSPAFLEVFYYLGIIIPGYVVVRGLLDSYFRIIPATEKRSLLWISFMHFLLGASNQNTLFKHLRGLTLLPSPTRFLGISDGLSQSAYILGFCVGSAVFAFGAFFAAVYLIQVYLSRSIMTRSRLMNLSNWASLVILISLNLSILSYYGADFLLTKAVGFLPNDRALWHTSLAPNTLLKDPGTALSKASLYPSFEFSIDTAPFDRPLQRLFRSYHLLRQPTDFRYRNFEELNYQGEKFWLRRISRHGSIKPNKDSSPKQVDNKSGGRALLRSLDKAIGWDAEQEEDKNLQISPKKAFTNRAREDYEFDFAPPLKARPNNAKSEDTIRFLEQKFKRDFFGQIGLIPGQLPPRVYGPFVTQEMAHKSLAFTNPVYKALLSFDIDLFLKRQPPNHSLSTQDEHNLFLKRQLLERYINTQRDYFDNYLTFKKSFNVDEKPFGVVGNQQHQGVEEPIINPKVLHVEKSRGTLLAKDTPLIASGFLQSKEQAKEGVTFIKSLANQTYKHQFKGTLEVVRQMFAVSLDCPNPSSLAGGGAWEKMISGGEGFFEDDRGLATPRPNNPRILKFDQPLYNLPGDKQLNYAYKGINPPLLHEELFKSEVFALQEAKSKKQAEDSTFDFPSEESSLEVFGEAKSNKQKKQEESPFLEPTTIAPFYAGWDDQRRQLVLTQRYLSRKDMMNFTSEKSQSIKKESSFTTWPIPELERGDFLSPNWRVPSRSMDQMKPSSLNEDEENGYERPLNDDYQRFVELWKKKILLNEESDRSKVGAKNLSSNEKENKEDEDFVFLQEQWPFNILYTQDLEQLETFDLLEAPYYVGVKRGGFVWPGGYKPKLKQN